MEPPEPLADSAPIAWHAAERLCPRAADTADTCFWYHRVWQYLRLLDVISSTRTNSGFMLRTFAEYARRGTHPRCIVTCTADYSMLAHLASAYAGERASLEPTVMDRCPTSLLLNQWYADRHRLALTTVE